MAEDADSEYQKLLWDAALESMGRDTVRIRLNNMPAGPVRPPSGCRVSVAARAGTLKAG